MENTQVKKSNRKFWTGVIVIAAAVLSYVWYQTDQLERYRRSTWGKITRIDRYRSGYEIEVTFTVNSVMYTATDSWSTERPQNKLIKTIDSVQVDYSYKDPSINEIILPLY